MNLLEESINIVEQVNYLAPPRYISGRIVEYDIKSANISTLRQTGTISEEYYQYLSRLPKNKREIQIGLDIKSNPDLYTTIKQTIRESKIEFVKANNIDPFNIVRVANDAVYINAPLDLQYTKFGEYIEFKQKSISNIYLKLDNVIIFSKFLPDGNADVDIKGIGDNMILHQNTMVSIIVTAISLCEHAGTQQALRYVSQVIEDYLHFNLPVGFYREFDSNSCYRLLYSMKTNTLDIPFGLSDVSENDKYNLDISYNLYILRELWSILLELYNTGR